MSRNYFSQISAVDQAAIATVIKALRSNNAEEHKRFDVEAFAGQLYERLRVAHPTLSNNELMPLLADRLGRAMRPHVGEIKKAPTVSRRRCTKNMRSRRR